MELLKLPKGNGQKVYIDLDWIEAQKDGLLFLIDDTPETSKKREVVNYLIDLGYDIVINSKDVSEDTFFFTPCLDMHINKEIEKYEENKDKKIQESLEKEKVFIPQTLNFLKDKFPNLIPTLPFVIKDTKGNGGVDKILIATEEQLDIFRRFYEEINEYSFKETIKNVRREYKLGDDVVFDKYGNSNMGFGIGRIDYKELLYNDFIMQVFIKTPTKYNTSLRVVVSSSLDIFGASLKYAKPKEMEKERYNGLIDRYLLDSSSPYYLGSKRIISNTAAGGNSILLGKNNYSSIEQEILKAHEIAPHNASVPTEVKKAVLSIMRNCHREIGAISGMDFIYDENTKKWNYLEQHEFPLMNTYCEEWNLPYTTDKDNLGEYIKTQCNADIDARLRALMLFMNKKHNIKIDNKKKIKTRV